MSASSCASACSWVLFSLCTSRPSWRWVTSRAFCRPTSTNFWSTSLRTTGMSAAAIAWAISPPSVPAPTTAALKTNMSVSDPFSWLRQAADPSGDRLRLGIRRVLATRPEEAAQAVLAPPRDDMDVQVRHRLGDHVVDRVEHAVGLHRVAHGDRQALRGLGQRAEQRARRVEQRLDVLAGDQQGVPGEQRPVVEEGEEALVLVDDVHVDLAARDAAEATAHARRRARWRSGAACARASRASPGG